MTLLIHLSNCHQKLQQFFGRILGIDQSIGHGVVPVHRQRG